MPDRILRESIRTSENIAGLTWFQEICYIHLLLTVSDDGTYDARPKILAKALFPQRDDVRPAQISDTLQALSDAELVDLFERDGKPFVRPKTWDRYQNARQDDRKQGWAQVNPAPAAPTVDGMELMTKEEAARISREQNDVLDAAEDAGFPKTNAIYNQIIDLYAEYGRDAVLDGIGACVSNNVIKTSYLRACCKRMKQRAVQPEQPSHPKRDSTGHEDWDDWT
jgi:DNA-binding transcriptional ArsR family regulator